MEAPDQDIMNRLSQQKQDLETLMPLLLAYRQGVYKHCAQLLRDASLAQKITVQTFTEVPGALLDYKKKMSPLAFLRRIATELCEPLSPARSGQWTADEEEQALISELSDNDRNILELMADHKYPEIAYILRISESTVRQRGSRARRRLRDLAEIKQHGRGKI
jgi:DNA-directed RNA polymerase specialized sigma24 family protein